MTLCCLHSHFGGEITAECLARYSDFDLRRLLLDVVFLSARQGGRRAMKSEGSGVSLNLNLSACLHRRRRRFHGSRRSQGAFMPSSMTAPPLTTDAQHQLLGNDYFIVPLQSPETLQ